MATVNLETLTDEGRVRNLTGHERGLAARKHYNLAEFDKSGETVEVHIPDTLDAMTVSFFQGMFADSVRNTGAQFLDRYHFHASPVIMEQVLRGIERVKTRRGSALG